ncbi:MAG TPA: transglycosylase SLT domain-containing protein [Burkholderiaceae bacterium]|nr:transglycosylase SLT domain-containing protein [Burkholderiaceae bacterium]
MTRTILHLLRLGGAATALLATLLPAGAQPASAASAPGAAPPAAAAEASGPLGIDAPRAGTLTALDARVIDALDAWRKRDRARLVEHRDALIAARHPLAPWADYWELNQRLWEARQEELDAFWARWPGSYVEDRLRNDWLLELGRRRDWRNFSAELPRFKMADDREVACYQLFLRHQAGEDVRSAARSTWFAQREADEGCAFLAATLLEARRLTPADVWLRARQAAELGRPKVLKQAVALLPDAPPEKVLVEAYEQPQKFLNRKASAPNRPPGELTVIALLRLAGNDPAAAAQAMQERWQAALPPEAAAWTWAAIAKQAAWKLMPEADGWFQQAAALAAPGQPGRAMEWSDDTLAWRVRATLRSVADPQRWARVLDAIQAMSGPQQADPTWIYWKARALQGLAEPGPEGEARRVAAQVLLERIAGQYHFYGTLAAEDLGRAQPLPSKPQPLTPAERQRAEQDPGLSRALAAIAIGLRSEGVREWNFSLRELTDRELLAAAQRACDREIWDRCINTSDRTRLEVDLAQRFPTPYRAEVLANAQELGIEPAYVYGLIRQESRFVTDARSHVGASGLMQVMPATAKWTARRLGLPFTQDMISDKATNLRIGTAYLKFVLEDFGGSQALAAAAYNAGPSRSRRWREGPVLEVAAWAENIPFNETRDYVKKVLSNASFYAALMAGRPTAQIRPRLVPPVGPRATEAPPENKDLP